MNTALITFVGVVWSMVLISGTPSYKAMLLGRAARHDKVQCIAGIAAFLFLCWQAKALLTGDVGAGDVWATRIRVAQLIGGIVSMLLHVSWVPDGHKRAVFGSYMVIALLCVGGGVLGWHG